MPTIHPPNAIVLAFGSLMDLPHARSICSPGHVLASGPATLHGFARRDSVLQHNLPYDGQHFVEETGGIPHSVAWMGIHPASPTQRITVRELLVDSEALAQLDAHEWMYRRFPLPRGIYTPTIACEPSVRAWIYRASRGYDREGWAPFGTKAVVAEEYAERIARGLRSLGAADEVVPYDHPRVPLRFLPVID